MGLRATIGAAASERYEVREVRHLWDRLHSSVVETLALLDRLRADVVAMGQKLKLPQKKIDSTLSEHPELQRIEGILSQLVTERQTR